MTADLANAIEAAWERRESVTPASSDVREVVEAALELLDPEGAPPVVGQMFDKNSSVLRTGMADTIKLIGYTINSAVEVVGHAASDELNPTTLAGARATAVANVLRTATSYTVTTRNAGTSEPVVINDKTTLDNQRTATFTCTVEKVVDSGYVQMDSSTPKGLLS